MHCLTTRETKDIERIQKRALSIISPGLSYDDSLSMFNMASLEDKRIADAFLIFCINSDHTLHHFLSPRNYCHYNLRSDNLIGACRVSRVNCRGPRLIVAGRKN